MEFGVPVSLRRGVQRWRCCDKYFLGEFVLSCSPATMQPQREIFL